MYFNVFDLGIKGFMNTIMLWIIEFLEAFCLDVFYYYKYGIPSLILVISLSILIVKSNDKKNIFYSLFLCSVFFIFFIRINMQHIGIMFYAFIFSVYLVKDGMNEYCKKIFYILFLIILCIQVYWCFNSYIQEEKKAFCAGKEVAEYLKAKDYKNKKIYASGYYVVSILPYFDENIFCGERGLQTYYSWSVYNKDWVRSSIGKYKYEDSIEDDYDLVILDDHSYGLNIGYSKLIDKFKMNENYKETYFKAKAIFKGINEESESLGFFVFEKIKN